MTTHTLRTESPLSDEEELEFAVELLAVNSDQELDQFLGGLLRRGASAMGGNLPSSLERRLGGWVKGAMHKIVHGIGQAQKVFDSADSGHVGRLAAGAGHLLGLEGEGMSTEDQELNAATQLVRLAGSAAAEAAASASTGIPAEIARHAMTRAVRLHAPGLIRSASPTPHSGDDGCGCIGGCSCRRTITGTWEKRGHHIMVHGV